MWPVQAGHIFSRGDSLPVKLMQMPHGMHSPVHFALENSCDCNQTLRSRKVLPEGREPVQQP